MKITPAIEVIRDRLTSWLMIGLTVAAIIAIGLYGNRNGFGVWFSIENADVYWRFACVILFAILSFIILSFKYEKIIISVFASVLIASLYTVNALIGLFVFLAVASALGDIIAGNAKSFSERLLNLFVGIAAIGLVIGVSATLPFHHSLTYAGLGLVIVGLKPSAPFWWINQMGEIRSDEMDLPERAAAALAIGVAGLLLCSAAFPIFGSDGLRGHLEIPTTLTQEGFYDFDTRRNAFSLTPKFNSWAASPAFFFGGAIAMKLQSLAYLGLSVAFFVAIGKVLGANRTSLYLAIASILSMPIIFWTHIEIFEESALILATTAAGALVLLFTEQFENIKKIGFQNGVAAGLVFAAMIAIKPQALFLGLFGIAYMFLLFRNTIVDKVGTTRLFFHFLAMFIIIAVFGGSSYLRSTLLTGNPFFPFDPQIVQDDRWVGHLSLELPLITILKTSVVTELKDGAFGITAIIGLIGAIVGLFYKKSSVILISVAILVFLVAISLQTQYGRYIIYPIFVSMLILLATAESNYLARSLINFVCLTITIINLISLQGLWSIPDHRGLAVLSRPFEERWSELEFRAGRILDAQASDLGDRLRVQSIGGLPIWAGNAEIQYELPLGVVTDPSDLTDVASFVRALDADALLWYPNSAFTRAKWIDRAAAEIARQCGGANAVGTNIVVILLDNACLSDRNDEITRAVFGARQEKDN